MSILTNFPLITSWGIDINKIILSDISESMPYHLEDYSAEEIAQYARFIPKSVNAIRVLLRKVGPDNVWIFCVGDDKQKKVIRASLAKLDFYRQTGLKKEQLIFVSDIKDKITVVTSLELQGYIDNCGEAIQKVQKNVKYPFWFAPTSQDVERWVKKMQYSVRVVSGWRQFMEINQL